MVGRAVFSPNSSARRAEAPGASSVSPRSTSTVASDATSSGRTSRWNEIPEALAAVSSEWRRSEEHTSELQSQSNIVCRLLLEKKKNILPSVPIRSSDQSDNSYSNLHDSNRTPQLHPCCLTPIHTA